MESFASAIDTLEILAITIDTGFGVWGVVNLLESYGSDDPDTRGQGIKQLMNGGGIVLIGTTLIPLLPNLFN